MHPVVKTIWKQFGKPTVSTFLSYLEKCLDQLNSKDYWISNNRCLPLYNMLNLLYKTVSEKTKYMAPELIDSVDGPSMCFNPTLSDEESSMISSLATQKSQLKEFLKNLHKELVITHGERELWPLPAIKIKSTPTSMSSMTAAGTPVPVLTHSCKALE